MPQRHLLLLLLITCFASSASADIEITPWVGYRAGSGDAFTKIGCVAVVGVPCPEIGETRDDVSFGLVLDVAINEDWMFELLLSHFRSDIEVDQPPCEICAILDLEGELEFTTYHLGVQRRFRTGKVEPFAALGVGITEVSSNSSRFSIFSIDDDSFSASVAAGLKVPLTRRVALRFEARGYWIDLPEEDFADQLTQAEVSSGLTFRW